MKHISIIQLLLLVGMIGLFSSGLLKAQSVATKQILNYYELKGVLLKHKKTVESMLSLKRFALVSTKERPESTIYAYKREGNASQVLIRVRKRDGLVSEVAWNEAMATLGNLTHDAVYDGFVPVNGNSKYYDRFQKMGLLVNYALAEEEIIPCVIRVVD